jgi:hypothetical protein
VLWFTIWFLVILKLPALYLAWIIWYAVKDPPAPQTGPADAEPLGEDGPPWRPDRSTRRARRPGPHGGPARRPLRARPAPLRGGR